MRQPLLYRIHFEMRTAQTQAHTPALKGTSFPNQGVFASRPSFYEKAVGLGSLSGLEPEMTSGGSHPALQGFTCSTRKAHLLFW